MTTPHRLTDERLAWLAAKPYCERQASKVNPIFGALLILGGRRARYLRQRAAARMIDYGVAVDDVARRLTAEERATVRATNGLPAWFYPAVDERYETLRAWRREG